MDSATSDSKTRPRAHGHSHGAQAKEPLSFVIRMIGLLMVMLPFTSLLAAVVCAFIGEVHASVYCLVVHAISMTWCCSTMWQWARNSGEGGLGKWVAFPLSLIFALVVYSFTMLRVDDTELALVLAALACVIGAALGLLGGTFCV